MKPKAVKIKRKIKKKAKLRPDAISKKQVKKNREQHDLAEERQRLLREEIERELPGETDIEPDLQSQLNEIQSGEPALEITIDTSNPTSDWLQAALQADFGASKNRIEERYQSTEPEELSESRSHFVVALIIISLACVSIATIAYFCGKYINPRIEYRDKIEYSRPMEPQGIPDNPWRKAIPILPEDIQITRDGEKKG